MNKGCILAPAAAPPLGLRPAGPAGVVARSLHATRHAPRSRLARGPGGQQQNVTLIPLPGPKLVKRHRHVTVRPRIDGEVARSEVQFFSLLSKSGMLRRCQGATLLDLSAAVLNLLGSRSIMKIA